MRTLRRPIALLAVLTLIATFPAAAEVFFVKLKNGNTFETRYRPQLAGWDENKVVFLTEVGNRISLMKDDIVEITSDTEVKGFGTVIDTTTIVIGWAPNDSPSGEEPVDPNTQWMQYLDRMQQDRPNFNVEQFVEPEEAGASGGGLPAWDFGPGPAAYGGTETIVVPPPPTPPVEGGGGGS